MTMKVFVYIFFILLFSNLVSDQTYAQGYRNECAEALGLEEDIKSFYSAKDDFLINSSSDNINKLTKSYNDLLEKADATPNTELHIAVSRGDISAIRFLISNGVPVDILGRGGATSLSIAAMFGRVNVVDFLLDLGASINASDVLGLSPLSRAANTDQIDVAVRLIERGANIDQLTLMHETPIMVAVSGGRQYMFHALASYGASLMNTDIQGWTLLHIAIIYPEVVDRASMVKGILGLDKIWLDIIDQPDTVYGASPLHWAAFYGHTDVIRVLLQRGALLTSINKDGELPIHVAARNNQKEAFSILRCADPKLINALDNEGQTPIEVAQKWKAQKVLFDFRFSRHCRSFVLIFKKLQ